MSWLIRPAEPADGDAILGLVERTPQPGAVTLNFERRPDFFIGAHVTCERPDVWVAERSNSRGDSVKAVVNVGWRRVFLDGVVRHLRYAHDLRIAPDAQGSTLLHRLFRQLRRGLEPGEWMQTVILDDNRTSVETVGSGRAGLPVYYPCGEIETSLLYTRRKGYTLPSDTSVRPAERADLADMQAFLHREGAAKQFFPAYDLQELVQGADYYTGLRIEDYIIVRVAGEIVGVLGTWNQKGFKQTRLVRYAPGMGLLRHVYNAHSRLRGGMHLPAAGGTLSYLALHSIAVRDNDPEIFRLLLDFCVSHFSEQHDALVCGLFRNDPLCRVPGRYRRQLLHSRHFLVSYDGDPREQLDARVPYVDVARL